jgi:ectoine hydroxylase-related dioxygenase (phytanoyl-CoA dioxygenase family)
MALSQEQLDFYSEHGYLKHGALLQPGEVEALRREYDEAFRQAVENNNFANLALDHGSDAASKTQAPRRVYQMMQMCERNMAFRKLIHDDRILDIVQDLLGPNIMLFHDQALFKPARHGGEVCWHQDNGYWQCRPANLVSCWLTLDDVRRENGAMQVIPGSHLKPVWHQRTEDSNALLKIEGVAAEKAVVIDLPAGGVMFHHCQTLHYTAPNTTDNQRRAFAIHFMTPGTTDGKGAVMSAGFSHPMLRMRA